MKINKSSALAMLQSYDCFGNVFKKFNRKDITDFTVHSGRYEPSCYELTFVDGSWCQINLPACGSRANIVFDVAPYGFMEVFVDMEVSA